MSKQSGTEKDKENNDTHERKEDKQANIPKLKPEQAERLGALKEQLVKLVKQEREELQLNFENRNDVNFEVKAAEAYRSLFTQMVECVCQGLASDDDTIQKTYLRGIREYSIAKKNWFFWCNEAANRGHSESQLLLSDYSVFPHNIYYLTRAEQSTDDRVSNHALRARLRLCKHVPPYNLGDSVSCITKIYSNFSQFQVSAVFPQSNVYGWLSFGPKYLSPDLCNLVTHYLCGGDIFDVDKRLIGERDNVKVFSAILTEVVDVFLRSYARFNVSNKLKSNGGGRARLAAWCSSPAHTSEVIEKTISSFCKHALLKMISCCLPRNTKQAVNLLTEFEYAIGLMISQELEKFKLIDNFKKLRSLEKDLKKIDDSAMELDGELKKKESKESKELEKSIESLKNNINESKKSGEESLNSIATTLEPLLGIFRQPEIQIPSNAKTELQTSLTR